MLNKSFQLSTTAINTHKKNWLPVIETRQVAGLDITLATLEKFRLILIMSAEILIGRGTTVQHRLRAVCNLHFVHI